MVKKSQRDRFKDDKVVDECIELDEQWKKERFALDNLNAEQRKMSKAIGEKMKASKGQDKCEVSLYRDQHL